MGLKNQLPLVILGFLTTMAQATTIPLDTGDPLVQKYIDIYTRPNHRHRMQAALDRMVSYRPMILEHIHQMEMPEELLYLPLVESEYKNTAQSHAGAVGLWQFMTTTGRHSGLTINYWMDERRDPEKATRAALIHLKELQDWFADWHLTLAAYNRGLYGLQKDLELTRSADFTTMVERRGLPSETEHYLPKFIACALIGAHPENYGFTLPSENEESPADEILLEKPLDIAIAARSAETTEETIRQLNPALRLWCTPKSDKPFVLKIPPGKKDAFLQALALVKDWTPHPPFVKYIVRPGDTLIAIARRHKTTVAGIRKNNSIRNPHRLSLRQTLLIHPGR
jgi:membrane-bound lytic murein transglycosylase D